MQCVQTGLLLRFQVPASTLEAAQKALQGIPKIAKGGRNAISRCARRGSGRIDAIVCICVRVSVSVSVSVSLSVSVSVRISSVSVSVSKWCVAPCCVGSRLATSRAVRVAIQLLPNAV